MHCALLHTQTAKYHGCNEFVHCCMPRPQSIVFHIASMANTRMSLSHSRYLQCYLKIRYIHGALRSGYATIGNAQCNNSEDNLFLIRCIYRCYYTENAIPSKLYKKSETDFDTTFCCSYLVFGRQTRAQSHKMETLSIHENKTDTCRVKDQFHLMARTGA